MDHQTNEQVQGVSSGQSPGAAPGSGGEDELLGVIDHVQAQLNSLKAAHAERGQVRTKLEAWERELSQREEALRGHAATLSEEQSRLTRWNASLEEEQRACARAREAIEGERAALDAARRQSDEELGARCAELEARSAEIAAKERQLESDMGRAGEAQRRIDELAGQLEEARGLLAQQSEELREARATAQAAGARAEGLATELARVQERGEQENAGLRTQVESLRADLLRSGEAQSALMAELQQRESDLEAGAASAGESVELRERIAGLEGELEQLSRALQRTRESLEHAEQDAEQWRARAESREASGGGRSAVGEIPPEVGELVMRRWNRLRLMRSLLREQMEKMQEASEALRARYEECEAILAQRQELAKTRAALAEMQRRLTAAGNKGNSQRAMMSASAVAIALAALLAIAWAVGGQVAPATYAARAVLKADPAGAGPDLLAEWQRYHEGLLKDPAFIEMAADRMNRSGIISLGTAGLLAARLEQDLAVQSGQNGVLTVELRGGGRKTERELDVLATAMAGQSNATRERRPDGLGAVVAEPAEAGEPIEDSRLVYAGGIFAGGSGLFCMLGLVMWRRMSAAKASFEKEHAVVSAEDASWHEAPQVLSRPRL